MDPIRQIKSLFSYQIATGAMGTVLAGGLGGFHTAASFAVGVGLALLSAGSLAWAGWRVFAQKSVARTVVIIISKYALLVATVVYLTRTDWFESTAGGLGLASFVLPALATAILSREN